MDREDWINSVHQGDAIETLKEMPSNLVDCVIYSPPYYKQRNYDHPDQLGNEDNYKKYIAYLRSLSDGISDVLKAHGNYFLNIGDKFSQGMKKHGMPRKNKMLIPHRVAIALQDRGWMVRGDYVWSKLNAKPSSVKDRLREEKEMVYHFVQSSDYFFDIDLIREDHAEISIERVKYGKNEGKHQTKTAEKMDRGKEPLEQEREGAGKKNIREKIRRGETPLHPIGASPGDVIEVAPETKVHDVHFAVYPPTLIKPFIKAGTPKKVCANCGDPFERPDPRESDEVGLPSLMPQCDCNSGSVPGVVLDPFVGSGTTVRVARQLNRRWIGIDLKEEYCEMTRKRVNNTTVSLDKFK